MAIKLSIVIPVYNSEKYLSDCLKSFCYQIKENVELILIDDASKDSSVKICKLFVKRFNFIKLIKLKKNKGVSFARNIGIKFAKGQYLFFVDSDDKLLNGSIKNILADINKFNKKDLLVLRYSILNENKQSKHVIIKNQILGAKPKGLIISSIKNLNRFELYCWNFIIKKELLTKNNIFFRNIHTAEDWVFVSEILCHSKSFNIIKLPVYSHRIHIESLGRKMGYIRADSNIRIIWEIAKFINKNKSALNKKKTEFLSRIIHLAYNDLFFNLVLCNKNEIKKITYLLLRSKKTLFTLKKLEFDNLNFLHKKKINLKKYLIKYKMKKKLSINKFLNQLNKKNIILFCIGQYGRIVFKYLDKFKVKVKAIIDSNDAYKNKKIEYLKIKKLEYLSKNKKKFIKSSILIANKNHSDYKKIKLQLIKIGYSKARIKHFNLL